MTDAGAPIESVGTTPVEDDVVGLQAALDGDSDVGDVAADYVEELLDICDLDGDIEIEDEGGRTTVKVTGGDLRLLSAPETVGALQELTRLAVQTRTGGFARLTLDIGGSRDQRSRELAVLVDSAVSAIADGAAAVPFAPMSSYERKLVHDLASERGLQSHSEGEGGDRHIVLAPA
ncbi:MAG: DNA-binding protein [Acidobacteria bacterium]|nr:DNA-binding protein [Acidobacteriota bacterium]